MTDKTVLYVNLSFQKLKLKLKIKKLKKLKLKQKLTFLPLSHSIRCLYFTFNAVNSTYTTKGKLINIYRNQIIFEVV